MTSSIVINAFKEREPIVRDDIKKVLKINNMNSLNQMISNLISFGILKRYENGIYYIPSSSKKFSHLEPSLKDVLKKKYLDEFQGIRTGSYLLYKYKFTSQVTSFYEILSNRVSIHTRSKVLYEGKVRISYPPFKIHKDNIHILEIIEVLKYMDQSDYNKEKSQKLVLNLIHELGINKEEILEYSKYYKGKRNAGFREKIRKVLDDEVAFK